MKRCIVDLDGVIADSSARFTKAEEAKQRALALNATERQATAEYWKTAFTPELVSLDTLIPGADQAVHHLDEMGWFVILLTSRPETMEAATETWLTQFGLDGYWMIMKPKTAQFVKTAKWKAEEVKQRADPGDVVLFIDDERFNRDAVEALGLENVRCKASLDEYKPGYYKISNSPD